MEAIAPAHLAQETPENPSLKDLLEDGLYLLFLLRNSRSPGDTPDFKRRIDQFLGQFDRNAARFNKTAESVNDAKYAFCALMDEIILSTESAVRDIWEREPLQLRLFGEHLAGEGFFNRLENLRLDPVKNLETLDVYYTCLLLGFQGKYLLEGPEKLSYLINRISQEIAHARGGKAEFAPSWQPTFRFQEFVRHELPIWAYYAILLVTALLLFICFKLLLRNQVGVAMGDRLSSISEVIDVPIHHARELRG